MTPSPPTRLHAWRWPLRLLLAVAVPLLLLLLLEGGLRLAGYGYDWHLYIPTADGEALGSNPEFGYRFFPRAITRHPLWFRFTEEAPAETYRIVLLGASAAAGVPNAAFGFGQILDVMLEQQFPGVDFEVINAGMPAINSHVVLPIAQECAGYDPDLFLVYLGNNEVIGPFNTGTAEQRAAMDRDRVRALVRLRTTRTGQLIQAIGEKAAGADALPATWGGMAMYDDNVFRPDDPVLATVAANFRANLDGIVDAAAGAGASVLLCTVASNLADSPPFASLNRSDLTGAALQDWRDRYAAAAARDDAGDDAGALAAYRALLREDDGHAELHFRLGRLLERTGDLDGALEHFRRARDLDALVFRATGPLNDVIRRTAADRAGVGARLLDVDAELTRLAHAGGGLPDARLFYEHVHFTFAGNHAVAHLLLEDVAAHLPDALRARRAATPPPDAAACAEALALTDFHRYKMLSEMHRLVGAAPFTAQYDHAAQMAALEAALQALRDRADPGGPARMVAAFRRALAGRPDDLLLRFNYARLLGDMGQAEAARQQMERLYALLPEGWRASDAARARARAQNRP